MSNQAPDSENPLRTGLLFQSVDSKTALVAAARAYRDAHRMEAVVAGELADAQARLRDLKEKYRRAQALADEASDLVLAAALKI